MKKIAVVIAIVLLGFILKGCEAGLSDKLVQIELINDNNAKIYLYQEEVEGLEKIDHVAIFSEINDLVFDYNFVMICFTKVYYDSVTEGFIKELFDILSSDNKIVVAFIDFPDYDFLEYTSFHNEKNHYPRGMEFIRIYNNFSSTITEQNFTVMTSNTSSDAIDLNIINAFSNLILEYNGTL